MSSQPAVPAAFAHLTNLAADETGTFVVYATDDYFAPKENLVRGDAPVWKEGEYTDRGKWMDGWESMRKREPGHDHAILRLGVPGEIHGLLCDTTHFKGNAPQAVSIEICEAPYTITAADLHALPLVASEEAQAKLGGRAWREVLPKTDVRADFPNELKLASPSGRATHVRFHIYPDGGVGRLRVYGVAKPEPRTFWQPASIDLVAIENGGTIAAVSDQFFGPPSNLLLPGRGVNMGDGWETKRRRSPGSDWCVLKLARRAVVERIEIDTHFFKGNAPQAALVECLDEETLGSAELEARLRAPTGWDVMLEESPLVQHKRHLLEPARPRPVTHLRVHIFPHGGVNRMRVYGHAVDTPEERTRISVLSAMKSDELVTLMLSFCGSSKWADAMAAGRPFASARSLFAAADAAFWSLGTDDFLEAFRAHPRIGEQKKAESATAKSAEWSRGEQSGVAGAEADVVTRLSEGNARYFEKFGFIFICFATGRSASQMLRLLDSRLENTREQEIENAAREQLRITRLRIEKWLLGR